MYGQLFKAQQKHQVALEVLSYHCCVLENEVQQWHNSVSACTLPNDFYRCVLFTIWYSPHQLLWSPIGLNVSRDVTVRTSSTITIVKTLAPSRCLPADKATLETRLVGVTSGYRNYAN